MTYIHTGDPEYDHVLDENSDEGHNMIKGLARWADSQVDLDRLRKMASDLITVTREHSAT